MKSFAINPKGQTTLFVQERAISQRILFDCLAAESKQLVLICDERVCELYGHAWLETLRSLSSETVLLTIPSGEAHKTRETKAMLEDRLLAMGCQNETHLIALGGGVILDMVGFLSSTYCRGIDYSIVPTTLLAMVDAMLGGKTAVNTPYAKNSIGSIYLPKYALLDISFLESLDERHWRNGWVELVKHRLLANRDLIGIPADRTMLESHLIDSIQFKQEIVSSDPFDNNTRQQLNIGHTIGHALEHASRYELLHGEAVAWGLLLESECLQQEGVVNASATRQLETFLKQHELLITMPPLYHKDFMSALQLDKKNKLQYMVLFYVSDLGQVIRYQVEMTEDFIENLLKIVQEKSACKWL